MSRVHREGKAPAILDRPIIDAIRQRRIEIVAAVDSFDATGVVLARSNSASASRGDRGDRLHNRTRAARRTPGCPRRARRPADPRRPGGRPGSTVHRLRAKARADRLPRSRGDTRGQADQKRAEELNHSKGPRLTEYVLAQRDSPYVERARLRLLQEHHDPLTVSQLDAIGVGEGWRCLDVGAGGGSVTRILAERVGSTGSVHAVERDTSLLDELASDRVEVRRLDLMSDPLPQAAFDLVHARLLLMFLSPRLGGAAARERRATGRIGGLDRRGCLTGELPGPARGAGTANRRVIAAVRLVTNKTLKKRRSSSCLRRRNLNRVLWPVNLR